MIPGAADSESLLCGQENKWTVEMGSEGPKHMTLSGTSAPGVWRTQVGPEDNAVMAWMWQTLTVTRTAASTSPGPKWGASFS